jgi:hypothetical protein
MRKGRNQQVAESRMSGVLQVARPLTKRGLIIILGVTLVGCRDSTHDAGAVVTAFYKSFPSGQVDSFAASGDLQRISPYLSRRLNARILDAVAYREIWSRHHPDEPSITGPPVIYKPPFADGFNFTSNEEGAREAKVMRTVAQPDGRWHVHVHLWYDRSVEGWEDVVVVKRELGRFVIDDVLLSTHDPRHPRVPLSVALEIRP